MDFLFDIALKAFGYAPGFVLGALFGWWLRNYVLKRNPDLIAKLDAEANARVDQARAAIDKAGKS